MDTKYCTICEADTTGNYCSGCGQDIVKKKTTIWSLMLDIFSNLIDFEKSVAFSILNMIYSPRKIIMNYIEGYRKYYPSPGKILFYALTVAAIHLTFIDQYILGWEIDMSEISTEMIFDPSKVFLVILLPLMALVSFLVFRKNKLNYAKHLVSTLYLYSVAFILITVIQDVIHLIIGWDFLSSIALAPFLFFIMIWNSRVHTKNKKIGRVALNVLWQFLILLVILLLIIFSDGSLNDTE